MRNETFNGQNSVATSADNKKFFFTPGAVTEYATYQRIMSSETKTAAGKTALYINLCQFAEGNSFGVYQIAFLVDPSYPTEKRNVCCNVNKLMGHYHKGKLYFTPSQNVPPVCNYSVNVRIWDEVRDIIIKSAYDCVDHLVFGMAEEYSLSLTA